MNVQAIRKFLVQLISSVQSDPHPDEAQIDQMKQYFKISDEELLNLKHTLLNQNLLEETPTEEQLLTLDDFNFLRGQFEQRRKRVKDTDDDYCFNECTLNQIWINFSKSVAVSYSILIKENIHYVNILFSCTNKTDYITRQEFEANSKPTDYFWGKTKNNLFNKKSFIEFVEFNKNLVIYRSSKEGNLLYPLSLDELERLRRPVISNQYGIKAAVQVEVWPILRKNIFPRLKKGEVLGGIFALLLELVNDYYGMIHEDRVPQHIKQYQSYFNNFIERKLYELELEPLNNFYGTQIIFNDQVYYVVEVLLDILQKFRREAYDITYEINLLSRVLMEQHKIFTPISFKEKELKEITKTESAQCAKLDLNVEPIAKRFCLQTMVSILNTDFNPWTYFSPSVSFWDIKVLIPRDIAKIYNLIIKESQENKIKTASYVRVARDINQQVQASTSVSFFSRTKESFKNLTRTKKTKSWLDSIREQDLPKINGYWFSASQILKAVLNFSSIDENNIKNINKYIDLILQTYCQKNHSDFNKELRVNYNLVRLLNSLRRPRHRHNLMLMLQMLEGEPLEKDFLSLCQWGINRRLRAQGYLKKNKSPTTNFFIEPTSEQKLFIIPNDLNTLSEVIQYYREKLPVDHLSKSIGQNILRYLSNLTVVIPSQQELEDMEDQRTPCDYIADPTS